MAGRCRSFAWIVWICRRADPLSFPGSLGRVAKWQTRWLQVPVGEIPWGFKSPLAHWLDIVR